jgi:hypothetical protein
MPTGDERFTSLSLGATSSLGTSIYLTIPPPPLSSSSPSSRHAEALFTERVRWLQAFERSYLFVRRSLSLPSLLNAYTTPITQTERLSCASFADVRFIPKSPSQQYLAPFVDDSERQADIIEDGDRKQSGREERAWWAFRLKKVAQELEEGFEGQGVALGSLGSPTSVVAGEEGSGSAWRSAEEKKGVKARGTGSVNGTREQVVVTDERGVQIGGARRAGG